MTRYKYLKYKNKIYKVDYMGVDKIACIFGFEKYKYTKFIAREYKGKKDINDLKEKGDIWAAIGIVSMYPIINIKYSNIIISSTLHIILILMVIFFALIISIYISISEVKKVDKAVTKQEFLVTIKPANSKMAKQLSEVNILSYILYGALLIGLFLFFKNNGFGNAVVMTIIFSSAIVILPSSYILMPYHSDWIKIDNVERIDREKINR